MNDLELKRLLQWWRVELSASRDAALDERRKRPWTERLKGGQALSDLAFARSERRGASGVFLWFRHADGRTLGEHRIRSGYSALIWPRPGVTERQEPALDAPCQRGAIVRVTSAEVCLRLPADYARFVETHSLNLESEPSEITFQRGDDAVRALISDVALARKAALLFGDAGPHFDDPTELQFRDPDLNATQRLAVERSVRARDVALVHGPPGTGKTRALVEIVRQALLQRRRVLVTAASNVAVDNLARRLADCGVKVLRLGAGDQVAPDLVEHTLKYKMTALAEMKQAQALFDEAQRIADGKGRRPKDPRKKISELRRLAHQTRDAARATVLRRARVVCATAGGVDAVPLGDEKFDLAVLDEATQAPDPIALSALVRGAVMVLAGDPLQLPPTVLTQEPEALEGLSSTLFERCMARWPVETTTVLTTQYRMSAELMRYPSAAHYENRLEAGKANRRHRVADLVGDRKLSRRDARPWIFIDTSSLDASEAFDEVGSSFYNEEHRQRVALEIGRLVELGIRVRDIAAICPYAAQTRRLRQQLSELVLQGLEIGTVDGFQGREKEVVVVDLVRANPHGQLGFLKDVRRTNVAITRAKRQLIVVAHGDTIVGHAYYRELVAAAKEAGGWEQAERIEPE